VPIIIVSIFISAVCQNKKDSEYFTIQEQSENINRKISYASNNLTDYSFGKETRAFGLKKYILDKYNFYVNLMYKLEFKYIKKVTPIEIIVAVSDAFKIFAVYGCISYSLWKNEISVGAFTQYVSSFLALSSVLNSTIASIVNLKNKQKYIDCYQNFTEVINDSPDQKRMEVRCDFKFEGIEFKNVSYKYPNSDKFILKKINLKITSLERIALVGKNGAGKTTFVKLLLRLYTPTEGQILINGININELSFDDYMRLFSVVFQDCNVYNYTIAENISMNEFGDKNMIAHYLNQLNMLEKISHFENGLDTGITRCLDGQGSDLSGGERQKLVIARALYKNAPIYIFDEPTSALSPESEYQIYNSFSSISDKKTVIYISHRLSSCKLCTRIIVIDDGEIIEDGTHNQLINNKGLYYDMYKAQADTYIDHNVEGK
jgi:ABC-type multidrug transport system fused ATPase/permease subunit